MEVSKKEDEAFKVKFRVKHINFRATNGNFAIVNALILNKPEEDRRLSKQMTIKGDFNVLFKNDEFEGEVKYGFDEEYGPSLILQKLPSYVKPENEEALAKFIATRVPRLSAKKAFEIVSDYGLDTIDLICRDKVDFSKYHISDIRANKIKVLLSHIVCFENLAIVIQELGYPLYYATKIYKEYGENSLFALRKNPYRLSTEGILPFSVADNLGQKLKIAYNSEERIKGAIHGYLNYRIVSQGDICVYKSVLVCNLNKYLKQFGSFSEKLTRKEIRTVLNDEIEKGNLVCERDELLNSFIYEPFLSNVENIIIDKIITLISDWKTPFCKDYQIDLFIDEWEKKYGELDALQIQAIRNSLLNNISILTGNPGTGKTFTTNLIVKCILSIKKKAKICLLAPTGKASERITELTGLKASTIHRGLDINQFSDSSKIEPIDADFIIVDESSMIDAQLFARFLKAVGEETRVILVGDVEQLPPIGAGLVLKDLIDSKKIPTIKLTTIFRQAKDSDIIMNAHAMIKGLDTKNKHGFNIKTTDDSDFHFIKENNTIKIQDKVEKLIDGLLTNGYHLNDICLLAPMKKGDIGTFELNERLQKKLNPNATDENAVCYNLFETTKFYIGDRVIQTKNNYDLQVFNGYVGEIIEIFEGVDGRGCAETQIRVEYPQQNKTVVYPEKFIDELDLCYAMTIHKSQGSEFPVIIIPIHLSQKQMLNRNLLYTGLTRGKKEVFMIGQEEAINYGINHVEIFQRISRIKEKILQKLAIIYKKEETEP